MVIVKGPDARAHVTSRVLGRRRQHIVPVGQLVQR